MIKIPLFANRLITLHQQARLTAHVAVEVFHPERLASLCPSFKFLQTGDEPIVFQYLDFQRCVFQCFDQAPFTRRRRKNLFRACFFHTAQQFANNTARVLRVVKLRVTHIPAISLQRAREVAHRSKDERDLFWVVLHISRLCHDLGHHHNVFSFVGRAERRKISAQLIPQYENEFHQGTLSPDQSKN